MRVLVAEQATSELRVPASSAMARTGTSAAPLLGKDEIDRHVAPSSMAVVAADAEVTELPVVIVRPLVIALAVTPVLVAAVAAFEVVCQILPGMLILRTRKEDKCAILRNHVSYRLTGAGKPAPVSTQ